MACWCWWNNDDISAGVSDCSQSLATVDMGVFRQYAVGGAATSASPTGLTLIITTPPSEDFVLSMMMKGMIPVSSQAQNRTKTRKLYVLPVAFLGSSKHPTTAAIMIVLQMCQHNSLY
jgi:hypothetical protein